jgi:hypothetical protein
VVVLFKLFAKTEKITMEDSRKANGMLKYRLYHAPALTPEKEPPVSIGWEAGWAPEPVWTQRLE